MKRFFLLLLSVVIAVTAVAEKTAKRLKPLKGRIVVLTFDDATAGIGPIVRIGHENNDEALSGVSVVATQYGRGEAAGVVAVIGPTRMDYSKVIKAVRLAQSALQDS